MSQGRTAVHMAAQMGQQSVLVALLKARGDPNARDVHGRTPLMAACTFGHTTAAKWLLDYRGDPSLQDDQGRNALVRPQKTPTVNSHQ
eukprot:1195291-Prorocentrum_minimum.AAC.4